MTQHSTAPKGAEAGMRSKLVLMHRSNESASMLIFGHTAVRWQQQG